MYIIENKRYKDFLGEKSDSAFPTIGVLFDVNRKQMYIHGDLDHIRQYIAVSKQALLQEGNTHLADQLQLVILPEMPADEVNALLDSLDPKLPEPDPLDQLIVQVVPKDRLFN